MFDIKSGVFIVAIITFLVIDRHQQNASLSDLKSEMTQLKSKMELMKELHSHA